MDTEKKVNGNEVGVGVSESGVTAEHLLASIMKVVGQKMVILPMKGWEQIVDTIKKHDEDNDTNLLDELQSIGIPIVPVALKMDNEPKIVTPGGNRTDGGIIVP